MAMICSSENLLLRILRLLSGGYGLYPNLEKIAGLRSGVMDIVLRHAALVIIGLFEGHEVSIR
jgi:hypothetical protein